MSEPISYSKTVDALRWPVALMVLLLIITPLLQVAGAVGTFEPGAVRWRYGTVGLLSGSLVTPLLGLFIGMVAAHLLGKRLMVRSLAVVCFMSAVLASGVLAVFMLDALQMRVDVRPEFMRPWNIATGQALLIQAMAIVFLGSMGLSGWFASRRSALVGAARKVREPNAALLVRTPRRESA